MSAIEVVFFAEFRLAFLLYLTIVSLRQLERVAGEGCIKVIFIQVLILLLFLR